MKKSLLYLEDDPSLAYVTQRSLQKAGFEVLHVSSLDEFRQQLKQPSFTHVLLDLKIGNDTSLELIQEIKSVSSAPIVILTGYGTVRTAVQAMKLGAINFLSKPCGIDEIIAALAEHDQQINQDVELSADDLEKPSLKSVEYETIQRALDENNGNISAAARQLKMHRRTLQRRLNKRHITD